MLRTKCGSSRYHLRVSIEASLRRLNTDYVDIYHLHGFDALTPIEETLDTLNSFVHEGKVRYIACSNSSGWHLMKSLGIADRRSAPIGRMASVSASDQTMPDLGT